MHGGEAHDGTSWRRAGASLHASAAAGEGAPPAASAAAGEGASRRRLMTQINQALKSKLHAMSVSMLLLVARTLENFVRVCVLRLYW